MARNHGRHRSGRPRPLLHATRRRLRRLRRRLPRWLRSAPLGAMASLVLAAMVVAVLLPRLGGGPASPPRGATSGLAVPAASPGAGAPAGVPARPLMIYLVASIEAATERQGQLEAAAAALDGSRGQALPRFILEAGTAEAEAHARRVLSHVEGIRFNLGLPGVTIVDLRVPEEP